MMDEIKPASRRDVNRLKRYPDSECREPLAEKKSRMSKAADGSIISALSETLPQTGTLRWIGLRPVRGEAVRAVSGASITLEDGLVGDRGSNGKRAITLIQEEHLPVIAALVGENGSDPAIDPARLRRNLVVSGINLLALKGRRFQVGGAILEGTGPCHPCSKMEKELGPGGWNAMRGHGGLCATVIEGGDIAIGDQIVALGGQ